MAIPYWQQRRDMKLKGKASAADSKAEKTAKSDFFAQAIKSAPSRCQNDNKPLAPTMAINKAAVVAHILPKSPKQGVPSMANNPLNFVYLCGDCHTNMDNHGCEFIQQMKIYPLMRRRVVLMWDHIPDNEKRRVPECLRPGYGLEEIAKGGKK
jgi:hypothetical protein